MKKIIVLIGILMSMCPSISAKEHGVFMEINMRNREAYTKVNRAPKHISLNVVFDDETGLIRVTGDESVVAEVFLYNSSGEIEDYSSSLNSNLTITNSGSYRILIVSEDWGAEGNVEV